MDWVWENSQSKGVARLIMIAIADKARAGHKAYASVTFLQQRANAGRSTVIGAVRELVASGELEIVEGESGRNGATVYRLPKAAGHVRRAADEVPESVQELHQFDEEPEPETGADSAPIESAEADGGDAIGAESAPIPPVGDQAIGAGTAPIQADSDGASNAPAHPESVQILDAIGAESAPHHQTPEEVLRTSSSARKRASGAQAAQAKKPADSKPKRTPANAGTRIPDDFHLTPDMIKWGRENFPHLNGDAITAEFIDYWRGVPGNHGKKLDWTSTWRNSVRRAAREHERTAGRNSRQATAAPTGSFIPAAPVAWCGKCNKLTRQIENDHDVLVPCPVCSPHRRSQ